ncbi:hypothetical protein PSQ90_00890 [Devosia rhodophyticola]|uniref:Uncharacterized protein n=1 Tax=Devosia rhodophyticola TaxID=3026423 RepID=A0ABY7YXW0_9HYPH|nr:hypothetical protein [Devosia rhodophyticola]WDR06052.1 hypothetical protein PSQ90_00890 [Devosia rhodophyticola]
MTGTAQPRVKIASLTHHLLERESLVVLIWPEDADKRLSLNVPFGCSLEALPQEAIKALRNLSDECAELADEMSN